MAGLGDVEEGVAGPEEAADDDVGAAAVVLEAPAEVRRPGHVLGGGVEEVQGPVEVGALKQRLLEELARRVHVQVVDQLVGLRLAQT